MAGVSWKKYKDTLVLICDYVGMETSEIIATFKIANSHIINSGKKVRVLSNFTGCVLDKHVTSYLKNVESKMASQNMRRSAVLGITGIKKAALNFYNAATGGSAKAFHTPKEALDWLVE